MKNMVLNAMFGVALCSSLSLHADDDLFVVHLPDPVEQVFTYIYKTNWWQSKESVSGFGSDLRVTRKIIRELSALIKRFGITSIADAPCGDLNWMQFVDIGACRYTGIDIVQELIESNIKQFGATREFKRMNLIDDIIEKVDLIICRDLLAHLTDEQVITVLRNFKKSGSKYLLVTTGLTIKENVSLDHIAGCRWVNLELPPYNFPRPLALIEEDVPTTYERGKHLALWFLDDINV